MADCHRCKLRRRKRIGRRLLLTAAYDGQSATVKRQNVDDVKLRSPLAKFVGKIRWRGFIMTLVDKETELEISSIPCYQPVQLAEEWSDVVVPRR